MMVTTVRDTTSMLDTVVTAADKVMIATRNTMDRRRLIFTSRSSFWLTFSHMLV
jgi:hypothetical protein